MSNVEVRDRRRQDWFSIDDELITHYGPRIGVHGIAIYAALCKHANRDEQAFVSLNYMTKLLKIGKAKLLSTLNLLEEEQLISIEHGDKDRVSVYTLLAVPKERSQGGSNQNQGGSNQNQGGGSNQNPNQMGKLEPNGLTKDSPPIAPPVDEKTTDEEYRTLRDEFCRLPEYRDTLGIELECFYGKLRERNKSGKISQRKVYEKVVIPIKESIERGELPAWAWRYGLGVAHDKDKIGGQQSPLAYARAVAKNCTEEEVTKYFAEFDAWDGH